MPKVGNKEFPYTPEGMAAAKAESQNMGIPVNDGANRSVTEYAGGGKTGYNMIGMQNPMMGHGGKMMKYEEGGLAGDLNGDGKLSIAEKNKLARAKRKVKKLGYTDNTVTWKGKKYLRKDGNIIDPKTGESHPEGWKGFPWEQEAYKAGERARKKVEDKIK